ncbi:MAG: GreA/GreB family elongation factor [Deinococcota bacterium]|jgi:transcription elongation factor GreA|nr:GreA/GreB family elongation factor [Deinococcota bacterium]
MKEELRYLVEVRRQELVEYMGSALADGDLRESAAYDEARMLQSANEARIADLEELISRAVVVEQDQDAPAVAQLGATLDLEEDSGQRTTFYLVGTHEADILENRISDESPLGQKLIGCQPGDRIPLKFGRKEITYNVVDVRYE